MPEQSEKLSFTLSQELGVKGMEVPGEVQVLPAGEVHPKGKTAFSVDEQSRKMILDAFAGNKTDLVIDYEHQSLSGSEAPAAGWIKDITDRGADGLWAKVQWTERAKEYLKGREYRYLSPVVLIRKKDGRAVELLGAALTNLPAIDGMTPVVNTVRPIQGDSEESESVYKEMFIGVLKMFELPEDAGLEEIQAKLASVGMPAGFVLKEEHEALKATLKTIESEAMIKEALFSGKITPSLMPWAKAYAASDPEGFRDFVGRACPVVPLRHADSTPSRPLLHGTQREVNRLLGISDESYIRHSPEFAPEAIAR